MSAAPAARTELELRDYVGVIRRRKVTIIVTTLIVVTIVMAYTFIITPVYEAQASIILEAPIASSIVNPGASNNNAVTDDEVATEAELMESRPINRALAEKLGYQPDVDFAVEDNSPRITITSRSTDPEEAQKQVNEFATTYVLVRQEALQRTLEAALLDVRRQIRSLDSQVNNNRNRIKEIDFLLADPSLDEAERSLLEIEKRRLEVTSSPEQVAQRSIELEATRDALITKAALTRNGENFTVSGSKVPTAPVEPRPVRNLALGLGVGFLLGLAIAFTRDYFDDTLRTKEDLDLATGGIPVLALVPVVEGWRDRGTAVLESITHPHSAPSEAYRTLRTALAFAAIDRPMKVIQITSSMSGEGKTTTAANLAVTLADAGKKVILVDCDLRRPRVHEFFGIENTAGFADVMLGTVSLEQAVRPSETPGLAILPSGPPPPNPAELLSTRAARDLLEKLATEVDHVIVDSPPLIPVADSAALALYVDSIILLVSAKLTSRRSLHRSIEILEQIDAPLEGVLFNRVGREATYGYGAYTYSYREPAKR